MLFYVGLKQKNLPLTFTFDVLFRYFGQGCSMKIKLNKKNPLAKYLTV